MKTKQWLPADEPQRWTDQAFPAISYARAILINPLILLTQDEKDDIATIISALESGPVDDSRVGAWATCPWNETVADHFEAACAIKFKARKRFINRPL